MLPNTDTKKLRRDGDKYFTVTPQGVLDRAVSLCSRCGEYSCDIREAAKAAIDRQRAEVKILSCKEFVPVISFSVTDGLLLDKWNTIRIGKAWTTRLRIGDKVAIADLRRRIIVRQMFVERVVITTIGDACKTHAGRNHVMLGKSVSEEDMEEAMLRTLRSAYGTAFAHPDKDASVIYLSE